MTGVLRLLAAAAVCYLVVLLVLRLSESRMLYVPGGCAHGYLTMEDGSEVEYPVSESYHPEAERGIRWNDPAFRVEWPEVGTLTMSEKDKAWPDFRVVNG